MNQLRALELYGQSFWLDYIQHDLIAGGTLQALIDKDGLTGLTSNLSIFGKAVESDSGYRSFVRALARQDLDPHTIYELLAVRDIRSVAHRLQPVHAMTSGRDGYVSLEVSPHLIGDAEETVREARRLWQTIGFPNLMVKVPATAEGIPAIRRLIGEGINVNATLIFSRTRYEQVAEAYLAGLEDLAARGGDLSKVASVASIFVSRIDTAVDARLNALQTQTRRRDQRALVQSLLGKVAIANARLIYQRYRHLIASDHWRALENQGAKPQRLLWASTRVKNPEYPDVLYVEELIGKDTVTTLQPATADAFRNHGVAEPTLERTPDAARQTVETLEQLGISLEVVADRLLDEELRRFRNVFDHLLDVIARQARTVASV